ncbi:MULTISPECIES: hypothetical protein [Clostridium]|uniref:hypothetical protein n=1 Tax=Clostridium TaxID=1485 RepID=UPI0003FC1D6F|nr:hypothetical protein [Clostridium cadaveris]MDU4953698.1 hypothetical protein [Clostridium sp.]NME65275.1 hypothetical protein [Clostridium cadaveris]
MDYDKMVSIIVEEVLDKLKETPIINDCNKKAVIFQNGDLEEFYDLVGKEYEVISYNKNIRECDIAILPKLDLSVMANLANLNASNNEEKFILNMLMKGKKIYVFENGMEYKIYKDSAPKQLYNKYLNFEKQLINYGIEIINESLSSKITTSCNKDLLKDFSPEIIKSEKIFKKVITENDIRRVHEKGENVIIIGEKNILTPLAKDFIKINNMEIIKRNG